jgi:hypothetical protein
MLLGAIIQRQSIVYPGDLDLIFSELGEDPGKAKKYPPSDAEDFATKWVHLVKSTHNISRDDRNSFTLMILDADMWWGNSHTYQTLKRSANERLNVLVATKVRSECATKVLATQFQLNCENVDYCAELADMFSENPPEAAPDEMEDSEAALHPVDVLKQMFPDVRLPMSIRFYIFFK